MGNPRDHAVRDTASKFSIFLPLRAIYFRSYQYETPCTRLKLGLALRLLSIGLFCMRAMPTCQPKSQKLLLVLLENAGKVLKGRKGFRNAGKVLKM